MKTRYSLFRRGDRKTYCILDTATNRRQSLGTQDKAVATQRLAELNLAAGDQTGKTKRAIIKLLQEDSPYTWADVATSKEETLQAKLGDEAAANWAYRCGLYKDKFAKFDKRLHETKRLDLLDCAHKIRGHSGRKWIKSLHNHAVARGWLEQPLVADGQWPEEPKGNHRKALTIDEHLAIVAAELNKNWKYFFKLLFHTGLSQTDAANLTYDNIDWQGGAIRLQRIKLQHTEKGFVIVKIDAAIEKILLELTDGGPQTGYLFPEIQGITSAGRSRHFSKTAKRAGVAAGKNLHGYRYLLAQLGHAKGIDERQMMKTLGHSSTAVHRAYAAEDSAPLTTPFEKLDPSIQEKLLNS